MPIRINLLAEAQAAEELRRRDPVKRFIWIAGFVVFLVAAWSGFLQAKILSANRTLRGLDANLSSQTNEFQQIIQNQRKSGEIAQKLADLQQLATNRFLWGTLLNALQQATVEDVQLLRLKGVQEYHFTDEIKPKPEDLSRVSLAKPAFVTEKITLLMDAKDSGPGPGDQVSKFKEALADSPFFQNALGKTNEITLKNLSTPQTDLESAKLAVSFALECRFPEKILK